MKTRVTVPSIAACIALASLCIGGSASAQFSPVIDVPSDLPTVMPAVPPGSYPPTVAPTAASPYSAPPAWSQSLAPSVRFVILSNFGSDAVLDRETGLVWSRRTLTPDAQLNDASSVCRMLGLGNRMGWRLPAVYELQSLLDLSVPATSEPRLPAGHPFMLSPLVAFQLYWASDTQGSGTDTLRFRVRLDTGAFGFGGLVETKSGVLCVRGPEVRTHLNRP